MSAKCAYYLTPHPQETRGNLVDFGANRTMINSLWIGFEWRFHYMTIMRHIAFYFVSQTDIPLAQNFIAYLSGSSVIM